MASEPDSRQLKTLYAATCVGLGEHERAIGIYRELCVGGPTDAEAHLSIGHALKTVGQTPGRHRVLSPRCRLPRPDFGDAYWSLANLKTYRFTDEELARMRSRPGSSRHRARRPLSPVLRARQGARGPGRVRRSPSSYYERGNELKRPECRYRPELIERNTREQIRVCTREFFAARRGWGSPSPDPIFIVGLPRSGSTLLEQILASHSQVEGTQELPNVQQIVSRLRGFGPEDEAEPRYPSVLEELKADDLRQIGEHYLERTRVYRSGKPFFIDKMPNNFRHVGLIHLMLPNARIIDARREPMACCFSQLQAAVRQRPGVHLQHRGHRALLPHLPRAHAPLGPGAAGPGAARAARGRGR